MPIFYGDFDWVLGTMLSTEPTMLHDDLVSWDSALLVHKSSIGTGVSQQQALSGEHEVTLFFKPVPEQSVEQDQPQILGPYSESLFDLCPKEYLTAKPAANSLETEITPGPGKFLTPI